MFKKDDVDSKSQDPPKDRQLAPIWRAIVEIGFIMFLFYSNLLMGEFTRSSAWQSKSLIVAIRDIVTSANLVIAFVSAAIGYLVVEYLRRKL